MSNGAQSQNDVAGSATLIWHPPVAAMAIATAVIGGGIGPRSWWLNTTVDATFHDDPTDHLLEVAASAGLTGQGVAMMTAVDVNLNCSATDDGVEAIATVGVGWPTWAADAEEAPNPYGPGTINICVWSPVRLAEGALVNAVSTVAEAKAQALIEHGVPGTGTASDALCVFCPLDGPAEPYAGPRSLWGARIARAVHRVVSDGLKLDVQHAAANSRSREVRVGDGHSHLRRPT
ncbi:MAG: adenosylcobinamide amidohydrolase [Acidimicrobiia bacterium]